MKRLIVFSLILPLIVLCSVPFSSCAMELQPEHTDIPPSPIHEIWGIPWGITMDEFIDLAYQSTGLIFKPEVTKDSFPISCMAHNTEQHTVLNYPLNYAAAHFNNENSTFRWLSVYLRLPLATNSFEDMADMFDGVFQALSSKYQLFEPPTFFVLGQDYFDTYRFDLPLDGNRLDRSALLRIIESCLRIGGGYASLRINVDFDNIKVYHSLIFYGAFDIFSSRFFISAGAEPPEAVSPLSLGSYFEYVGEPTPEPKPVVTPNPYELGF